MSAEPPLPDDLWAKTLDVQADILALAQTFEQRTAGLEARLNWNSNTSKPLSAEPHHVKWQPPLPASGKRRGGQPCARRCRRPEPVGGTDIIGLVSVIPTTERLPSQKTST